MHEVRSWTRVTRLLLSAKAMGLGYPATCMRVAGTGVHAQKLFSSHVKLLNTVPIGTPLPTPLMCVPIMQAENIAQVNVYTCVTVYFIPRMFYLGG